MNYKNLLFDLDGTIIDSKIGITRAVKYALNHFGINVDNPDTLCDFVGPPLDESFIKHYGLNDEEIRCAITKFREYFSTTGIYENEIYPGMKELLTDLNSNGKNVILATSKPRVFAESIINRLGLTHVFKYISGSEFDGTRMKKNEVISWALKQNNITDNSSVLMIGDREHDIIGAKANNIDSAGVLFGFGSRSELDKAGADYIFETVIELREFLLL